MSKIKTMREQLEKAHEELFPGVKMVIAWDCDECGTVMDESEQACTNCGFTYAQKCANWS